MKLGQLLLHIQDYHFYDRMRGGFASWTDLLEKGFPAITGLQLRSAYDAMNLAQSPTLRSRPDREKDQINSVANARTIISLERGHVGITPETISAAKKLPNAEFRRSVGVSRGRIATVVHHK